MDDQLQSRISRVTAFLEIRMAQMLSYHDHKETMAHATMLVALAYVGAVFKSDPWPPEWIPESARILASIAALAVWMLIHVTMRWHLQNRRVAAHYMECLLKTLRQWADEPPSDLAMKPYSEKVLSPRKFDNAINLVVPWRYAKVPADEGISGYPQAMADLYLEGYKGDLLAEYLLSYGSIALGVILLIRTISPMISPI